MGNGRIKAYADGKVTFRWKDYRDQSLKKIMTVAVDELIRRFLLHIRPDNFYRIGYFCASFFGSTTDKIR